jgi:hypothetical protein
MGSSTTAIIMGEVPSAADATVFPFWLTRFAHSSTRKFGHVQSLGPIWWLTGTG